MSEQILANAPAPSTPLSSPGLDAVRNWFASKNWQPFPFQEEAWAAHRAGAHGLIHAPTGMGKSYAAWLGPLSVWIDEHPDRERWTHQAPPLQVLWLTPLRALAGDTTENLLDAVVGLGLPWSVELRTGDTSSTVKQRQRQSLPTALVTTPESLTLMLSYPEARTLFANLRTVVVDEWHELMGSKRGVQTELALARLRTWHPDLCVWGLSATLGNLPTALDVLAPPPATNIGANQSGILYEARLISADLLKTIEIDTLIPENIERFPWAGHLGLKLLPEVVHAINQARSTLVFTNTRAQTEVWFQSLLDEHPDFAGEIALHHGSLQHELRQEIEERLRDGRLRCVVCTSSLDLGVDFSPVDQVIQIGSPKGVARLLQRAGRSGHQPGARSRILCVPIHAFELVEFAAVREAITNREVESRQPLIAPLDVLVQHIVTMALSGGFVADELLAEVRTTHAYRELTDIQWQWALDFVTHGGNALRAYEVYRKVTPRNGIHRVTSPQIARFHRMSIGTITADAMLSVKFMSGTSLGTVEESFIARLRPGDHFIFAGRRLEFLRVKDLTAYVRPAKATADKSGIVPRWNGGRMPLSTQLATAVRRQLTAARDGIFNQVEMRAVAPILAIQAKWSHIPVEGELLIEEIKSRDGYHLFVFPLLGRVIHEGLSTLIAYRLTLREPCSISTFATDYGFELLSPTPFELDDTIWAELLSTDHLLEDVLTCVNSTELARRQFRDIARIAGLIFSGYPGSKKSMRQLQTSSGLLYEVFRDFDPDNLLLDQARREVLDQQLDLQHLRASLVDLGQMQRVVVTPRRLTPFAFPIWADRLRTQVSSEDWTQRIQRMVLQLERAAD
jgi:ATP-dependent helicase Lhr and Lhr-like helicase